MAMSMKYSADKFTHKQVSTYFCVVVEEQKKVIRELERSHEDAQALVSVLILVHSIVLS